MIMLVVVLLEYQSIIIIYIYVAIHNPLIVRSYMSCRLYSATCMVISVLCLWSAN